MTHPSSPAGAAIVPASQAPRPCLWEGSFSAKSKVARRYSSASRLLVRAGPPYAERPRTRTARAEAGRAGRAPPPRRPRTAARSPLDGHPPGDASADPPRGRSGHARRRGDLRGDLHGAVPEGRPAREPGLLARLRADRRLRAARGAGDPPAVRAA